MDDRQALLHNAAPDATVHCHHSTVTSFSCRTNGIAVLEFILDYFEKKSKNLRVKQLNFISHYYEESHKI